MEGEGGEETGAKATQQGESERMGLSQRGREMIYVLRGLFCNNNNTNGERVSRDSGRDVVGSGRGVKRIKMR